MELANKKTVKLISLVIAAIMVVGVFVLAVHGHLELRHWQDQLQPGDVRRTRH